MTYLVVPAVAAAILGRLTSLTAVVVGGLAIGVIEAIATPFPDIAGYRSATPFIFAALVLLWYQRGGLVLSRIDQFRSVPASFEAAGTLWQQLRAGIVVAVIVAIALPYVASAYWLKTFTGVTIIALCSLSVAVLYAQLGMVSLCQYALFGVGGWVTLRLYHGFHIPFEIDLLAGGVAAAIFGVIFGLPAMRMRGLLFRADHADDRGRFPGVHQRDRLPRRWPRLVGQDLRRRAAVHAASADRAERRRLFPLRRRGGGARLFARDVDRTHPGRACVGAHPAKRTGRRGGGRQYRRYKVVAFALAGFLAGVAGGLMAANVGQLDGRAFPASESIMMFALTVIGGAFHWSGPIFAGLLLRAIPSLLTDWHIDGNLAIMVFGAGLLHALITAPQGVSGQVVALSRLLDTKVSAAMPRIMERKL